MSRSIRSVFARRRPRGTGTLAGCTTCTSMPRACRALAIHNPSLPSSFVRSPLSLFRPASPSSSFPPSSPLLLLFFLSLFFFFFFFLFFPLFFFFFFFFFFF